MAAYSCWHALVMVLRRQDASATRSAHLHFAAEWKRADFWWLGQLGDGRTLRSCRWKLVAGSELNVGRAAYSATVLLDGRVLVASGVDVNDPYLVSAELLDLKRRLTRLSRTF